MAGGRVKRARTRQFRGANYRRQLPRIRALCRRLGIEMAEVEHGYQFHHAEYILNWAPSTNRVWVQYRLPGHATVAYTEAGQEGKPKIILALEKVHAVCRRTPDAIGTGV